MAQLTVSIALATYNGGRYIKEQLDSYSKQQRLPDEVIVSDDGSTDDTIAIVDAWKQTVPFEVRLVTNLGEHGHTGNFYNAIANCTGDCILISDQDDFWLDTHISSLAACFEQDPNLLALASDSNCVDEQLNELGYRLSAAQRATSVVRNFGSFPSYVPFNQVLRVHFAFGHGMAIRRGLVELSSPLSKNWGHDCWLFLIAALMGRASYVNMPLTLYRQHATQTCGGSKHSLLSLSRSALTNRVQPPQEERSEAAKGSQSPPKLADLLEAAKKYHDASENGDRKVSQANADLIMKKHAFLVWRNQVKSRPLPQRVVSTTYQLLLGRYHLFGRGFIACARDIIG